MMRRREPRAAELRARARRRTPQSVRSCSQAPRPSARGAGSSRGKPATVQGGSEGDSHRNPRSMSF